MKKLVLVALLVVLASIIIATSTEAAPIYPPKPLEGMYLFPENDPSVIASVTTVFQFGDTITNSMEFTSYEEVAKYCIATPPEFKRGFLTYAEGYIWEYGKCKNGRSQLGWRLFQISNE